MDIRYGYMIWIYDSSPDGSNATILVTVVRLWLSGWIQCHDPRNCRQIMAPRMDYRTPQKKPKLGRPRPDPEAPKRALNHKESLRAAPGRGPKEPP